MDPKETFNPFQTGQTDLMYAHAREMLEEGLEEILKYGTNLLKEEKYDELKSFIREKTAVSTGKRPQRTAPLQRS